MLETVTATAALTRSGTDVAATAADAGIIVEVTCPFPVDGMSGDAAAAANPIRMGSDSQQVRCGALAPRQAVGFVSVARVRCSEHLKPRTHSQWHVSCIVLFPP